MSENRGMGVLLGILGGNPETVSAIKSCLGNTIERVWLDEGENELNFKFTNGVGLRIWDKAPSCCEHRYMVTADDLSEYENAKLLDFELKDAPSQEGEYGEVHEIRFLDVKTDKGAFQMANHNEHNGEYGGFWILASLF